MMLDDLAVYRIQRIRDVFLRDLVPFTGIGADENNDGVYFGLWGLVHQDASYVIAIIPEPNQYKFIFKDDNDAEASQRHAMDMLEKMGFLHDFTMQNGYYEKAFPFPESEGYIIDYTRKFKENLYKAIKNA